MSRAKLVVMAALGVVCALAGTYTLVVLHGVLGPAPPRRDVPPPWLVPPSSEGEGAEVVESGTGPKPEDLAPPRPLEITGYAWDVHRRPLAGARIFLELAEDGSGARKPGPSGETAEVVVDASGAFRFPAAARPRWGVVRVQRGAEELARFDRVLLGDRRPGDASWDPQADGGVPLPARPRRLRWAVNVSAGGGAGGSGGNPGKPLDSGAASDASPPGDPASSGDRPREPEGKGKGKGEPAPYRLAVVSVLVEDWGTSARVRLSGTTDIPDGLHIHAHLSFDRYRVAAAFRGAEVRAGRWISTLPVPPGGRLYSGEFMVEASFSALLEDPAGLEEKLGPDALADLLERGGEVDTRRAIFIGGREQARREDVATQEYYRHAVDRATELRDIFYARYREIRADSRGWSPERMGPWLQARASWLLDPMVTAEGELDEERWRRFLDEEWRPEVRELRQRHRSRGSEKYREARGALKALLDSLLQLSYLYSILEVYPLFGLPAPHPNDLYQDEAGRDDIVLLESLVDHTLHQLARFRELVPEEITPVGTADEEGPRSTR